MTILDMSDEDLRERLSKYPQPSYRFCCWIDQETIVPCRAHAEWMIVHGPAPDDWSDSCSEHLGDMMTDAYEHRVYRIAQSEAGGG